MKITTHVKLPVTSQSKCVVIFAANRIGDPRSRISQKYSAMRFAVLVKKKESENGLFLHPSNRNPSLSGCDPQQLPQLCAKHAHPSAPS